MIKVLLVQGVWNPNSSSFRWSRRSVSYPAILADGGGMGIQKQWKICLQRIALIIDWIWVPNSVGNLCIQIAKARIRWRNSGWFFLTTKLFYITHYWLKRADASENMIKVYGFWRIVIKSICPLVKWIWNILLSRYLGYLWFVLMLYNCYPKLDQENVQRYISKVIFQGLSHGFSMNILIFLAQYPGFSVVFISFSVFLCTYSINPTEWGQSNFRGGLN